MVAFLEKAKGADFEAFTEVAEALKNGERLRDRRVRPLGPAVPSSSTLCPIGLAMCASLGFAGVCMRQRSSTTQRAQGCAFSKNEASKRTVQTSTLPTCTTPSW